MQCRSNVSRLVIVIALLLLGWPHSTTIAANATVIPVAATSQFTFSPPNISIKVGDTVTWTNTGGFHNVAADDASFRNGDPSTSFTYSHQFTTPGVYGYHCEVHAGIGMVGTVTVTSAAVLTPTAYLPLITR